jgi:hypothetical protein
VSDWAGSCDRCGGTLDEAVPVDDPTVGKPLAHPPARRRGGRRRRTAIVGAGAVLVLAVVATVAATLFDPAGDRRPTEGLVAYSERFNAFQTVDLGTGRSEVIDLPADGYPERPFVTDGSIVFLAAGAAWATDPPGSQARPLGAASHVFPSDVPGTVWRVRGDVAERVDLAGRSTSAPVTLPEAAWIVAPLPRGKLLLQTAMGHLQAFDPDTRAIGFDLGAVADVAATHGTLVAWLEILCDGCPLHLTDVATGVDRAIAPPQGSVGWVRGGAISPDGATLAVFADASPTTGPDGPNGQGASLVLVDVRTGRTTPVPGSTFPVGEPVVAAAWSPTSGWLFFSGIVDPMLAYRPGLPAPVRLAIPWSYSFTVS